jgi:dTDP-4-dehydrorhamnose reductase
LPANRKLVKSPQHRNNIREVYDHIQSYEAIVNSRLRWTTLSAVKIMIRILLTGTSGQIGGALWPLLQTRGTVLTPNRSALDLSKPQTIEPILDELAPNLIVNPAAYTSVDRAEDEPELATLVNAEAPAVFARWAAVNKVPLLHFSTDYVFDGSSDRAWREEDLTRPLSVYGRSKLAGEEAIRRAGGPHLVIRTAWVYAANGANFMRTIIRLAREQDSLRIVADQQGTPTSAQTIAAATTQIIDQNIADLSANFAKARGLVHMTNLGSTNWHTFACAIVNGLRTRGGTLKASEIVPISTRDYPTKASRPANSRLDLSRLACAYGILPPTWETALDRELDSFLALEKVSNGP